MIEIIQDYGLALLVGQFPHGPLGGVALTLFLAAAGLLLAFPLALLLGIARTSELRWLRVVAGSYTTVMRGLPLIMLIFWAYFIVPMVTGFTVSGVTTVLVALVAYEAAFMGEIVRSGIEAVPSGQREAAKALGLGRVDTMLRVILPQALVNTIPSFLNQFSSLIKNTSLAYVIGVNELTYAGSQVSGQLMTRPLEVYLLVAAIYFVICFALSGAVNALERRVRSGARQQLAGA